MIYKLKDLVTIKYGKNQKKVENPQGDYPILGTGGLMGNADQFLYDKPSVLIGRKGSIGKVKYIDKPFWTVDTLFYTEVNQELVIPRYLYYKLSLIDFNHYNEGTTIPSLRTATLNEIEIDIQPLNVQKAIVDILSSLEDKIELNNKMNQTLEKMAMTLYNHWFVDFGPFQDGEFVDSKLGRIPKGWEVTTIKDSLRIYGGGTPKTKIEDYWLDGVINWFTPTDVTSSRSIYLTSSAKKISNLGLDKSSAKLFPPYSIMMTSRATLGEVAINREASSTNQGFINIIPNEQFRLFYIYLWLKNNKNLIISISNGSTFKEVSKKNFKELKILKSDYIIEFNEKVKPLFEQIESNTIEIKTLVEMRDYLLPKLLSGEIDLPEAKERVEEVVQ
ncbi:MULTISPECIES: restriction endonuclease subunit S [Allobacillus]|uniref:restriction endonuclease subunit S n=1 Tax=Allobacillus TaxID=1400133 RepID=UPI001642DE2A|nr:restriction endonuclease subunit S [Allobacillus salarius]